MATNYTPPQFEGGFQRSAQSLAFNPETAIDTSSQEEKKLRKIIEDDEVRARTLQRQQGLDTGMLQAKQTSENAERNFNNSKANANLSLLKGLTNFSTTLANTMVDQSNKEEQRREEVELDRQNDEILSQFGWGPLNETTQQGIAEVEQTDMQITAEAQGIGEVSQGLSAAGDDSTAQQLTKGSLYSQDGPQRRTIAQAKAIYGGWIQDKVSQIDTAGMTDSQIQAVVMNLNREFAGGVQRSKGDRRSLLKLAETMNGFSANAYQTLFSTRREGLKTAQETQLQDTISLAADEALPGQAFNTIFAEVQNDPLFRGTPGTAKNTALSALVGRYEALGQTELIEELMLVDPGTGTPFGKDAKFDVLFRNALVKSRGNEQAEYTSITQSETREISQIVRTFHKDMDPQSRQRAIQQLEAIGSKDALEQARSLMGGGMLQDVDLAYKVEKAFNDGDVTSTYSKEELEYYINLGVLDEKALKFAKEASPEMREATKVAEIYADGIEDRIKANVFETSNGSQAAPLEAKDYKGMTSELALRSKRFQEEFTRELTKSAKRLDGKDLETEGLNIMAKLLAKDEYKLAVTNGQPVGFMAPPAGNPAKFRITRDAGNRSTKELSYLTVKEVASMKADGLVDTHRDRLYNGKTDAGFVADIQALAQGQRPSQKTQDLAATLGISTRELIDNQMRLNNMGTLDATTGNFYREEQLKELRNVQPTDYRSTASALQDYGVPPKASEQLARLSQVNFAADDGRVGLPGMSQRQRDVLNRIAVPESGNWGYDAANEGSYDAGGTQPINPGTGTDKFGRPLTSMTVGEVLQLGADGDIHAAGRYQFIHDTLKEQVGKFGVPKDAMFDESMQDYLTLNYMRQNPTAWIGVNQHDPGAIGVMNQVAREPLPPAPWLGGTDPKVMMMDMRKSNPRQYNIIMNKTSSPNMVRAAINDVYGGRAGAVSTQAKRVYTTGNLGYGSTGDHVDIKPVSPGKILANRNLPMTRSELDAYVAVGTPAGLQPLSKAMQVTSTDQDHRNRSSSSHGIDFAAEPNRELYLTNGARVVENYHLPDAAAEGSHRLLIEVPGGKRYAFLHGTSQIRPSN